jgi:fermentation-respiration switch protein FrsA (DUF1100 family)
MSFQTRTAADKKLRYRLLFYLVIFLIFAMPISTALEQHFIYFPTARHDATPNTIGLSYEEVDFQAGDGTQLRGWLIPGEISAPVVLFCIGNAGNISHRLETLQLLHNLGVNVFFFNYRGYGTSQGKASEPGLYLDVLAAIEQLHERGWQSEDMIIFGRSLGAAVALEAAIETRPAGLIMESAFTSIAAMGRYHYSLLNLLFGWLIDAEYNNLGKISTLKSPLLLIHGKRDKICPPEMAKMLFDRAPEPKSLYWIKEADHNNGFVVGGDQYKATLQRAILKWTGFSVNGPF